mgnify:CR=1 FL=1
MPDYSRIITIVNIKFKYFFALTLYQGNNESPRVIANEVNSSRKKSRLIESSSLVLSYTAFSQKTPALLWKFGHFLWNVSRWKYMRTIDLIRKPSFQVVAFYLHMQRKIVTKLIFKSLANEFSTPSGIQESQNRLSISRKHLDKTIAIK